MVPKSVLPYVLDKGHVLPSENVGIYGRGLHSSNQEEILTMNVDIHSCSLVWVSCQLSIVSNERKIIIEVGNKKTMKNVVYFCRF